MRRTYLTALAVGFLLTVPGWAQEAPEEEDGPGRGVARLSLINGDVSVRRGDSGDWIAAAANAPLVVEDHVLTGVNSRAEVQFDWANLLRLAADTDVRLAELENRRYQAQVARGTVTMSVLRDSDADVSIDTPNVSVRPIKKGTYRVAVLEGGETEVTVRSGEVEIYTPRGVERLKSGRTMIVRGTQSDPEFQMLEARNRDEWDRWNEERDRRLERSKAYAYVSRDIYGAEELDDYGVWVDVAPYGRVWRPYYRDAGWAPYQHGRWVWVDWYGWTWVSYDPWGWAPYHYGRWFHDGPSGWCWYPGPVHGRHFWRPALVAFVGFNAGPVNVGVGFGRIGWVPLAPYERYRPWYGRNIYHGYRGGGHGDNVRIVNNINITNVYRNSRVRNGVSGMDYNDFGRGGRARAFTNEEIRVQRASVVHGALPVAPGRESLRLADREVRTPMARGNTPERFYTRRQPAKVERVSFADQQRGMQNLTRRTFGEELGRNAVAGTGGDQRREAAGTPGRTGQQGANAGGWRRVGGDNSAQSGGRVERNAGRTAEQPGGWRGNQARTEGQTGQPAARDRQENNWRRFGGRPGAEARTEGTGGRSETERPEAGQATRTRDEGRVENEGGRQVRNEATRQEGNNDGWRRFGGRTEGGSRSEDRVRPDTGRRETDSDRGWRGNGGAQRQESGGGERSEPRRVESPRSEPREVPQSSPRMSAPEGGGSRNWSRPERSEPVRINPPIVRERSGGDGGSNWRGNGGGGGGAERSSGGGGGWRGNSGGGGGQRSSGGGSQRSEGGGGGRVRGGGRDR
ncbi:MAG TPA: DUF6600 domain-containing protein [Bryobacteraceae bacterium]|nr:DUF6600 domain-containing protein [Bryobacteraceae bacterium]